MKEGVNMKTKSTVWKEFKKQSALQAFMWMGIVYLIIFNLIPMFGLIMGFKDYSINMGIKVYLPVGGLVLNILKNSLMIISLEN